MIVESLLARVMRRQVARILSFDGLGGQTIRLPRPESARGQLLYAHVPFCEQLCPYCSFNRVRLEPELARRYFDSLCREMELYGEQGWRFSALYVGGGTPTVLPDRLAAFLARARELWDIRRVSVETNPNHLTPAVLDLLRASGVNRLSVGVQSFDDDTLRAIGRYEPYGSGLEVARRLGDVRGRFETVNVDMIFNFPGQSEAQLRRDLATIRELEVDQVTFYPLMAARGVRRRLAELGRIDPRQERRLYRTIQEELGGAYRLSSAWCFSRRDGAGPEGAEAAPRRMIDEYVIDHPEYAGLGSGSFGYVAGMIYANTFVLPEYIGRVDKGELPIAAARSFSRRERIRYDFLMGLFGGTFDLRELDARHGRGAARSLFRELLFLRLTRAVRTCGPGGRTLALTRRGCYYWVILMREFFTGVNNLREHCLALQG